MLPNLIRIGAMKCATTSFHYYLVTTPDRHVEKQRASLLRRGAGRGRGVFGTLRSSRRRRCAVETSPTYTMYPKFLGFLSAWPGSCRTRV